MTWVRLVGGPLHGQQADIDPTRAMKTFEIRGRPCLSEYFDGQQIEVTQVDVVSYRRVDAYSFRHCETPRAIGDAADVMAGYLPAPLPPSREE